MTENREFATSKNSSAVLAMLPARPGLYLKISALAEDPKTTVDQIAREILTDGAATMALLRLANSAAYYRRRQIPSISEAITVVGLDGVRVLLLTVSLQRVFRPEASELQNRLWREAVTTAVISRAIAGLLPPRDGTLPERAYIAGLLHDMGRLALLHEYGPIALRDESAEEVLKVEQRRFGHSHAELGAAIATDWNLPESIRDAVLLHHDPTAHAADVELAAIVHVAALLARHDAAKGVPERPSPVALLALGWIPDDYNTQVQLLTRYHALAAEIEQGWGHQKNDSMVAPFSRSVHPHIGAAEEAPVSRASWDLGRSERHNN